MSVTHEQPQSLAMILHQKMILPAPQSTIKGQKQREAEVQPHCLICKGTGYLRREVPIEHEHFGKAIPCQCTLHQHQQRQQQHLIDLSGISTLSRFRHASFETYDPFARGVNEAYSHAVDFANQPEGWLLLVGAYGCGKTHLAVSIAKKQIEMENMVIFQVVPQLLDYLRAGFTPDEEEGYQKRFQQLCDVNLLILDDFGAHSNTPWAAEKLFQLLNHRYNAHTPTVITMNTTSWQHTDPRLYSRFHEKQLVSLVVMDQAPDYRLYGEQES